MAVIGRNSDEHFLLTNLLWISCYSLLYNGPALITVEDQYYRLFLNIAPADIDHENSFCSLEALGISISKLVQQQFVPVL